MKKNYRRIGLALLILGLTLAAGCSGKQNAMFRGLDAAEINQLNAMEEAKYADKEQMAKAEEMASNPAKLEKSGDVQMRRGDNAAAAFQYTRALPLVEGKDKTRLRLKIAKAHLEDKRLVMAGVLYQELAKEAPQNPEVWQGLGITQLSEGQLDKAEESLKKATSLEPRLWKSWNALGIVYNRLKSPEQAVDAIMQALTIRPDLPTLHNNLGLAFLLTNDYPKAEKCFLEALSLNQNYELARNNLGLAYARQGRWAEAYQCFSVAMGEAKAHNTLGVLLAREGDKAQAAEHFQRAIQASPSYYKKAVQNYNQVKNSGIPRPVSITAQELPWNSEAPKKPEKTEPVNTPSVESAPAVEPYEQSFEEWDLAADPIAFFEPETPVLEEPAPIGGFTPQPVTPVKKPARRLNYLAGFSSPIGGGLKMGDGSLFNKAR